MNSSFTYYDEIFYENKINIATAKLKMRFKV